MTAGFPKKHREFRGKKTKQGERVQREGRAWKLLLFSLADSFKKKKKRFICSLVVHICVWKIIRKGTLVPLAQYHLHQQYTHSDMHTNKEFPET